MTTDRKQGAGAGGGARKGSPRKARGPASAGKGGDRSGAPAAGKYKKPGGAAGGQRDRAPSREGRSRDAAPRGDKRAGGERPRGDAAKPYAGASRGNGKRPDAGASGAGKRDRFSGGDARPKSAFKPRQESRSADARPREKRFEQRDGARPDRPPRGDAGERRPRAFKPHSGADRAPDQRRSGAAPAAAGKREWTPRRDGAAEGAPRQRDDASRAPRFDKRGTGDRPPRKTFGDAKPAYGARDAGARPQRHDGPRPAARRPERPVAEASRPSEGQRIAKIMARAGLCSRRDAELWVAEGRVTVNGAVLTSPAFNVGPLDRVVVDGQELPAAERTRLFLFHKPRGLVTTDRDPEQRMTIFDHLQTNWPDLPRVVSVGRLDINTEGLLLLTNDGGLARVLELPATGWLRRYRVRANGETDQAVLDRLKDGITIEGVDYAGIEATLDRVQGANSWMTIGLREGKNREIKRVLEHLGLAVNRLIRMSFGPFQLNDLPEGAVEEVRTRVLRDQLGTALAEAADADFDSPTAAERLAMRPPRGERGARERGPDARAAGRPRDGAPEREERPQRGRPEKGTRQHVSTLRANVSAERHAGPRVKIARGETADRKGRAVAVERVFKADPKAAADSGSRNARRFGAARRQGEGDAPPRAKTGAPFADKRGDGPRARRTDGGSRPVGAPGGKRFDDKRPGGKRPGDNRPGGKRPDGGGKPGGKGPPRGR